MANLVLSVVKTKTITESSCGEFGVTTQAGFCQQVCDLIARVLGVDRKVLISSSELTMGLRREGYSRGTGL